MRRSRLLDRAAVRVQRRGTLQMRRRIPQPIKTTIVQMREDRGYRPATVSFARQLRAPHIRVQFRQNQLVHRVVAGIRFQQRVANLSQPRVRPARHICAFRSAR